jgi:hypothetical protein
MSEPILLPLHFPDLAAEDDEPLRVLATLLHAGAVLCSVDLSKVPPLDRLDPAKGYISWTFTLPAV